jgi:hypothetical protein
LLRIVLGEAKPLPQWRRIREAITSEITKVESLRSLDRLRLAGALDDRELGRRRATMLTLLGGFELVRLNRAVLSRAAEPFPTQIRTLDAIHVASALLLPSSKRQLYFATHDDDMATAAIAVGLRVIGAEESLST